MKTYLFAYENESGNRVLLIFTSEGEDFAQKKANELSGREMELFALLDNEVFLDMGIDGGMSWGDLQP